MVAPAAPAVDGLREFRRVAMHVVEAEGVRLLPPHQLKMTGLPLGRFDVFGGPSQVIHGRISFDKWLGELALGAGPGDVEPLVHRWEMEGQVGLTDVGKKIQQTEEGCAVLGRHAVNRKSGAAKPFRVFVLPRPPDF